MNAASGETGPPDAELVAGVLAGDREAFAAVYDRYGDRLYDFAHSMLRQREDAEDAVADSFVLVGGTPRAAARPGSTPTLALRDRPQRVPAPAQGPQAGRLRRRGAAGRRWLTRPSPPMPRRSSPRCAISCGTRPPAWPTATGRCWTCTCARGSRVPSSARRWGSPPPTRYVMLNRLRAQVERSLGALLIARLGRDDCDDLDGILVDWDGRFSPLVRKRVARHVDDCDVCSDRRRTMVSPLTLLAGVPVVAAPLSLRDRVVDDTELVAYSETEHAVPEATPQPGGGRLRRGDHDYGDSAAVAGRRRRRPHRRPRPRRRPPGPRRPRPPRRPHRPMTRPPARSPSRPSSSTSARTAPPRRCC